MSEETMVGPLGVEGIEIKLGDGNKYVIAALTFGPAKRFKATMTASDRTPESIMSALAEALRNSLARNYPDITLERVEEALIDYRNKDEVQSALHGQTFPKPAGEPKPGEEKSPAPSIGTDSTQT